jgi:nucleolar protein 14
VAAPARKEFNPRYEAEFAPGRSNDPDRARAGAKQLKRALAKEQRGAMRELRKDAAFMAQVGDVVGCGVVGGAGGT